MKLKKFLSLLLSAAMAFSLLTATAFAAAPAEEENGFFDFLLGEKYTYLYAALTWDEYWANEKVYAAGNAAASAQLDSHEEQDLGAFDAVSRATVNHGLHRGSIQSTAEIIAKDGRLPKFCYPTHIKWLAVVGRYTIWIYVLHQPIIYFIFSLIFH